MITLETGQKIWGVAGTNNVITYTLLGDEISTTDAFKRIAQGQLPITTPSTLYTAPASTQSLIKSISLANTSASPVTGIIFYVGSSAAATTQLTGTITIPANGTATYADGVWYIYGADGILLTTVGGAAGGDLTGAYPNPTVVANAITNAKLADVSTQTFKGRTTAGTGDPEDLTTTQATALLNLATTSLKGLQSANDKLKEDNMYYDVTANSIATLVGDDSTDNTSAWNTLFAALPVGATVFFPAGTYRTSTGFNISADKHLRIRGAGKYTSIIKITGATGNGFHINGSYWYNTFEDMGFTHLLTGSSVTGGAGININPGASGSAVGTNIYRCWFSGLFIGIRAVGSQAANLSVWDSLDISASSTGFANAVPNARGVLWNGDTINMVMTNSTINMIYPAPGFSQVPATGSACMEVNQSGAIQLIGGEYIGGVNTLLLNANAGGTTSVAAIYATNCFFDQSGGATVKITGANIVNRCKFVQCGITGGDTSNPTAIEVASSGTGAAGTATAAADGIDFFDCDIYPNGGTGTKTGVLINGSQAVDVSSCRISGWTSGITVTPVAANGYTKFTATGNKLGATNNFTTPNTVGITLNAGSFQYGIVSIDNNDFTGSTTPLSDASTIGPTHFKNINGNNGLSSTGALPPLASGGGSLLANGGRGAITGTTVETFLCTFRIPANGVQVGDIIHITALVQGNGTGTNFTPRVRVGAAGTIADALVNVASAANTGTANSWHIVNIYVYVVALGPTATVYATLGSQGTAAASTAAAVAEAPGNVPTTAAWFITFTGQSAANGHLIRNIRARFI